LQNKTINVIKPQTIYKHKTIS